MLPTMAQTALTTGPVFTLQSKTRTQQTVTTHPKPSTQAQVLRLITSLGPPLPPARLALNSRSQLTIPVHRQISLARVVHPPITLQHLQPSFLSPTLTANIFASGHF